MTRVRIAHAYFLNSRYKLWGKFNLRTNTATGLGWVEHFDESGAMCSFAPCVCGRLWALTSIELPWYLVERFCVMVARVPHFVNMHECVLHTSLGHGDDRSCRPPSDTFLQYIALVSVLKISAAALTMQSFRGFSIVNRKRVSAAGWSTSQRYNLLPPF